MTDKSSATTILKAWLVAACWVYLTWLFGWLLLHLLTGDRLWFVSLATSLIPLAFWPLPALIVVAALTGRRSLWAGSVATSIVWLALFGGLFNVGQSTARAAAPTLRVMTYNVEYNNTDVEAVVQTIRAAGADLVGLQELTPALATRLGPALKSEYPYQAFDPRESVTGMGVVSRYPFEEASVGSVLNSHWIGEPQVLNVELPIGKVTILNVHFVQGKQRDLNAEAVAWWINEQDSPVMIVGDLNATDLSDAYDILTASGLQDAWRDTGWGYGSTFPATAQRTSLGGIPFTLPARLVRIDYVFYTSDVTALSAERLAWDGQSDHLAVVAELSLAGQRE